MAVKPIEVDSIEEGLRVMEHQYACYTLLAYQAPVCLDASFRDICNHARATIGRAYAQLKDWPIDMRICDRMHTVH